MESSLLRKASLHDSSNEDEEIGDGGSQLAPTVEDQINAIGVGKFHYSLMVLLAFLCAADGMEMVVLSLLSSQLQKEWGASKVEIGALASAIFVGVLIGSLIGGAMGDRIGRRRTLLVGGSVFVVGGVASALSPNLLLLGVFRSVLGLGFGIFLPAAMCNFAELVPTKDRANFQLFLSGVAWAVGEVAVCLAAIVLHKYFDFPGWWRILLFFCTLPGIIGLILAYFYLPESPQYLSIQGRHEEVEALILRVAQTNRRTDALLQGGRIRRIAEEPDAGWSWFQLFSKDLLLLTLAVSALWSICSFAYYGMTFAYPLVLEQRYRMDFEKQYWAVLLAAAAEIPGIFLAMHCVGHRLLGRRLSMAAFFFLSAVVAILVPFFEDSAQFLAANMALKTVVNGAFSILTLFAVEIFPTTHRASGVSLCGSVARVAGICAPLTLAYTLTSSVALTYQVVALTLVAGLIVALVMPFDTSMKRLASFTYEAIDTASAPVPPIGGIAPPPLSPGQRRQP